MRLLASPAALPQAAFSYDAHKSGGVTVSHLRFGSAPISASYYIEQADYLAVHVAPYMQVRVHLCTCCASGHFLGVCVG